jgi:hypothetical protein
VRKKIENVRNEVREEREQAMEQLVEQLFQAHWNAANATQRSSLSEYLCGLYSNFNLLMTFLLYVYRYG